MAEQKSTGVDGRSVMLPFAWRGERAPPAGSESVLAAAEVDLAEDYQFQRRLLLASDRHLWISPTAESSTDSWRVLPLDSTARVELVDHPPIGKFRWIGDGLQVETWHFTSAKFADFRTLTAAAERVIAGNAADFETTETVCPGCGAPLASENAVCLACAEREKNASTSTLWRLRHFARPYARQVALGFSLTVAATLAGLVPPYLTMPLMDRVLVPIQEGRPADYGLVKWYLGGLALAAVAAMLLSWARTYVMAWVSERISADLRTRTYSHLQKLSLEFFGGKRTGDLMTRIGSDTDNLCTFLSLHALDFANDVLMITLTACILISIDPTLALVTLLPFPFIAWLVNSVRGKLRRGFDSGRRAWSRMTSVLADTIPGIRVVKAFAQEQREIDRFRKANDHILVVNDRVNRTWSYFGPVVVLLTEAGLLVIWACGAWRVAEHAITVGVLTAFLTYIGRFYARLDSMSRIVSVTQRAAAGAQRVFEILDRVPSVPGAGPSGSSRSCARRGRVSRTSAFRYGSRQVDGRHQPFDSPGRNDRPRRRRAARARSTLVNLVCRFYDVGEGAILVDGTDIRSLSRARVPPQYRHRAAGAVSVLRYRRREHRLRQAGGHA
jgi:ATP-binding cassette subfamily B protein